MGNMHSEQDSEAKKAWWQHPIMWLIVGGPAVVVIASMLTIALAIRYPETLVDERKQTTLAASKQDSAAMMPAVKARNHVATSGQ
jgi:hypothetical protein